MIRGATSVLFEGKPIAPNPGILWEVVDRYKVKGVYMAPTAVRIIKKEDYDGDYIRKHSLASLQTFNLVGERCDPDTVWWIHRHFPQVVINDTWWQTETGWPMGANFPNKQDFKAVMPTLPGSVTKPVPGYEISVIPQEEDYSYNENEREEKMHQAHHMITMLPPNTLGRVVVKLPMPPSFMLTLWGNDEAFVQKYLTEVHGYYTTGDAGFLDDNGYLHIMTRVDDVINTAGHRLSTGQFEEVINEHPNVIESAVVGGRLDPIRGDCAVAFVIARGKVEDQSVLFREVNEKVRKDIGPIARLEALFVCERLPKTRSGKILRSTLRKIINKELVKVPATIEDPGVIEDIIKLTQPFLDKYHVLE